jgi:hypothetical protein
MRQTCWLMMCVASLVGCAAPVQTVAAPSCPCRQAEVTPPRSVALDALALQRVELARKRIPALRTQFEMGRTTMAELTLAYRDVAVAARDSGLRGDPLRRAIEDYQHAAMVLAKAMRERVDDGRETRSAVDAAEAAMAEAEYWGAEARERP